MLVKVEVPQIQYQLKGVRYFDTAVVCEEHYDELFTGIGVALTPEGVVYAWYSYGNLLPPKAFKGEHLVLLRTYPGVELSDIESELVENRDTLRRLLRHYHTHGVWRSPEECGTYPLGEALRKFTYSHFWETTRTS